MKYKVSKKVFSNRAPERSSPPLEAVAPFLAAASAVAPRPHRLGDGGHVLGLDHGLGQLADHAVHVLALAGDLVEEKINIHLHLHL